MFAIMFLSFSIIIAILIAVIGALRSAFTADTMREIGGNGKYFAVLNIVIKFIENDCTQRFRQISTVLDC